MGSKELPRAFTVDEQLANLKELGLIIEDEDDVREFLNHVAYYRFVKAYSLSLKQKNSNYKPGTSFDQIRQLYMFNTEFRHLILPKIEKVEILLRCQLANYFSVKYGVMGYLDPKNFDFSRDSDSENGVEESLKRQEDFFDEIDRTIIRNKKKSLIIQNFKRNYKDGEIPFYAVVEVLSFGTLSKFCSNMKSEDKKKIADLNHISSPKYFTSWMACLSYVRNICAHYGRLYNFNLVIKPRLSKSTKHKNIQTDHIMAVLYILKELLSFDENWGDFVEDMDCLLKKYPVVDKSRLGFPKDWKDILLGKSSSKS